jgi:exodeoxyribonuclease VII small subunit
LSAAKKSASSNSKSNSKEEPKSFEDALERLEEIVEELEGGEPPLEKAVALYEEGVGLFRYSREQLDAAQKRVEELAGEAEEVLFLQSFEDEDESEKEE